MRKKSRLLICLTAVTSIMGCGQTKKQATVAQEVTVPAFNADSAFLYVEQQMALGARVPGTPPHAACVAWMEATLEKQGAHTSRQTTTVRRYDGKMIECVNVIGSYSREKSNRILLCAHWDSRFMADYDPTPNNRNLPVPGANDGASGVGVLMEVARQLQLQEPMLGVDIILFDAEDQGAPTHYTGNDAEDSWCLGAQYWSRNPHKPGYRARFGILLDMVGRKNATFYRDEVSAHYAKSAQDKVWKAAAAAGFSAYFINKNGGAITDDHLYINAITGIPTVDIIDYDPNKETGFFEQWHTTDDVLTHIDRETLRIVGQTVLKVIYEEK